MTRVLKIILDNNHQRCFKTRQISSRYTHKVRMNIKSLIYPTDVQLDCSERMFYFTLKCSYIFRFNNHYQGAKLVLC